MKIFVSYTLRDGALNSSALEAVESVISIIGDPYIDLLHNHSNNRQAHVIRMLQEATALFACITPGFFNSEWVQLELHLAKLRGIPILPFYPFKRLGSVRRV